MKSGKTQPGTQTDLAANLSNNLMQDPSLQPKM